MATHTRGECNCAIGVSNHKDMSKNAKCIITGNPISEAPCVKANSKRLKNVNRK